ncbi:MAG: hypothetical protein M0R03_19675 [Novosphingobium sp.]|nr:hypothetical protein [Novosphingobium sp.]
MIVSEKTKNSILNLFNRSYKSDSLVNLLDYNVINKTTIKFGVMVHPDACTQHTLDYLLNNASNYNTTFYKSWDDVVSKDRFELLIDQIIHYSTTYGTNFTANPYIPNDNPEEIKFNKFFVILPIYKEEVQEKIESMLYSGIALKSTTINDIIQIVLGLGLDIDVEKVANREVKMILYKELGLLPKKPEEMIRFLVYVITNQSLVIKNKQTFYAIKNIISKDQGLALSINGYLNTYGIDKLSSVFYRFKPLFLAMKTKWTSKTINRLRKAARKNHVAYKGTYFETLLSKESVNLDVLKKKVEELNNYKKIAILQTINVREKQIGLRNFIIRNGKSFIKESNPLWFDHYKDIYNIVYESLINSIRSKNNLTIKLPKNIEIALPTSEKSFIGNYPYGTRIKLTDTDSIIGISWKEKDGAEDIDLSFIDISGNKIGWNSDYYNKNGSIVYSGDMTSAKPEATELLYAKKGFKTGIIKANLYSGHVKAKYKMFFASEKIVNMKYNYMVDSNNIIFEDEFNFNENSKESSLGIIDANHFTFLMLDSGMNRVSHYTKNDYSTHTIMYIMQTKDSYLKLKDVLVDAEFVFVEENADIDLSKLDKSTLIQLFEN